MYSTHQPAQAPGLVRGCHQGGPPDHRHPQQRAPRGERGGGPGLHRVLILLVRTPCRRRSQRQPPAARQAGQADLLFPLPPLPAAAAAAHGRPAQRRGTQQSRAGSALRRPVEPKQRLTHQADPGLGGAVRAGPAAAVGAETKEAATATCARGRASALPRFKRAPAGADGQPALQVGRG